ncbi:hypothetical protein CDO52_09045 [Nocardiopsis gilva YIM 90087]|uniref:Phospholipase n=1 Tax=Nocardiopsis gilva YIM 90087 TaxID=1235441 RepID=A0A223S458_9ACTN|nr:phospholipase [Nocardiopsis gilva]ASU82914.1 hypothetical protein CDO52_09045 [Nocardiopsis gilva YIM 90087]
MRPFARRAARSSIAVASAVLLSFGMGGTAHADLTPDELRRVTDEYLFGVSLSRFITIRDSAPYAGQLDWSSDSCSWSPDNPVGYNFDPGCKRHDFGYRNYKKQSRFTEPNRLKIDNNFRDDLYGICDGDWLCRGVADIYYNAVREFGGSGATTAEALVRGNAAEKVENLVEAADDLEQADTQAEADRIVEDFEEDHRVEIAQDFPVS